MPRRDSVTSLVLIALGIFVVIESLRMPRMEESGYGAYAAPGVLPGLIGGVIAGLGILMLIRATRAGGWKPGTATVSPAGDNLSPGARNFGIALALVTVYSSVLVGWIPFWLATFLFVSVFIAIFEWKSGISGRRRAWTLGTAGFQGILVAVAITYLFERVFRITLPG